MTLTKEEIDEYKALFKKEYGIDLTDAQAFDKGSRLVRFVKLVLQGEYKRKKREKNDTRGQKVLNNGSHSSNKA